MIEISFYSRNYKNIPADNINEKIEKLALEEGKTIGNITLVCCTDDDLLEVNQTHLNHDYYTDIITFDYCESSVIHGDLFLSMDRIQENAATYEVSFEEEWHRVVFHGVLHLIGYGDKSEEEIKLMRAKENHYLDTLFHVKQ